MDAGKAGRSQPKMMPGQHIAAESGDYVVDHHRAWSEVSPGLDLKWCLVFRFESGKIKKVTNFCEDQRTLQGGSDLQILRWCFKRGRRPSKEDVEIWNTFMRKRE